MGIKKHGLYSIDNKIIQKNHIQQIAKLIWLEYDNLQSSSISKEFKVHIKCFDRFSYTADTLEIFNDDSEIYKERLKSIEIVSSCDDKLFIKLRLNHGQMLVDDKYLSDSDIEIGGSDIAKIHDLQVRILQEVQSIPPQDNVIENSSRFIAPSVFIIAALSFGFAVDIYNRGAKNTTPYWREAFNDFGNLFAYSLLPAICGAVFLSIYNSYSERSLEIWPNVELHIGPEHLRPEVKKRKKIILFFTIVILPLLTAFIYDMIKAFAYALK